MKLYRNWIINEVARAGEHTNERTYVLTYIRTGQTLYPEGIIKKTIFARGGGGYVRLELVIFFSKTLNKKKRNIFFVVVFFLTRVCENPNLKK